MRAAQSHSPYLPAGFFVILAILVLISGVGLYRVVSTFLFFHVLIQLSTPTLIWLQINSGILTSILVIPALIQWIKRTQIARTLTVITFFAYSLLYWIDHIWISAHPSFQSDWWVGVVIMLIIWAGLGWILYSPAMELIDWKVTDEPQRD